MTQKLQFCQLGYTSENPNQWQWVKLDTATLGRGEHTIGLTPREIGCLIDQIAVGLGESFEPGGDDPLYEPPPRPFARQASNTNKTPPATPTLRRPASKRYVWKS